VSAAGSRTDELARTISEHLKSRVGLKELPTTSVEVVQFRPFYILGRVEKPGEYPYRPDLSVVQAVSIAGGLPRVADPALMRLGRELASARGGVKSLKVETAALRARRARLETEMSGGKTVKFPQELLDQAGDEAIARILKEEQLILSGRQETMKSQIEAINDLKTLLTKEITSLEAKLSLKDRQLSLLRRELNSVEALVNKGLAVAPRQFSLERAEADIETSRLEIEAALLRARQEVSRTDRDAVELRAKRENEILADIRETQAKLDDASQRLNTAQTLLGESERFNAQYGQATESDELQPQYSIVRRVDGQLVETQVSETSSVEPGDLVKVWLTKQKAPVQVGNQALRDEAKITVTQAP
jgi:protein involved in polysaccharide export with SLBB domain